MMEVMKLRDRDSMLFVCLFVCLLIHAQRRNINVHNHVCYSESAHTELLCSSVHCRHQDTYPTMHLCAGHRKVTSLHIAEP